MSFSWGCALLMVGLAIVPAHVEAGNSQHTITYLAPSVPPGVVLGADQTTPGFDVGGARFFANGRVPIRLEIVDASGQRVPFKLCQIEGTQCESNVWIGCGNTMDLAPLGLKPDLDLLVAVFVTPTTLGEFNGLFPDLCGGTATIGHVTVTYASA